MTRIIVSGAGIAGLSFAFEALRQPGFSQKHKITVVEKRTEFTRDRVVFLDSGLFERYFDIANLQDEGYQILWSKCHKPSSEGPEDINKEFLYIQKPSTQSGASLTKLSQHILAFLDNISKHEGFTTIKAIQEYLLEAINIRQEEFSARGESAPVEIRMGCKIVGVEIGNTNTAILQNTIIPGEALSSEEFDDIVIADGVNSETVRVLESQGVTLPKKETLPPSDNEAYGSAAFSFRFSDRGEAAYQDVNIFSSILDPKLTSANYDASMRNPKSKWTQKPNCDVSYPSMRITKSEERLEVMGQVPEVFLLLDESEQERAVSKWFSAILKKYFGDNLSSLKTMHGYGFSHPKEYYSSLHFKLGAGGNGFIIGDSRAPSLFILGEGVRKAVYESSVIAHFLNNGIEDESILSAMTEESLNSYNNMLLEYLRMKYQILTQVLDETSSSCVNGYEHDLCGTYMNLDDFFHQDI